MFKYPMGVQLFNRPRYARRVLESIRNQTLDFDDRSLTLYIDGFEDSVYHRKNRTNFTNEVESIAREFFPDSEIKKFDMTKSSIELLKKNGYTVISTYFKFGWYLCIKNEFINTDYNGRWIW